MATLTVSDIERLLPHRFPFLFVDQVTEFVPGQRIVAIKHFSVDDQAARGNPPGMAIIPTGIVLELVTQVGAVLVMARPEMAGWVVPACSRSAVMDCPVHQLRAELSE